MPRISLTDFVDIVLKSGTPKATKLNEVINRPEYHPATDFYRLVRDWIVATHSTGDSKSNLPKLLPTLTDKKKMGNYASVIEGYKKWWGAKSLEWFHPATGIYTAHGIDVSVNPELGLILNDKRHLVKLYFKSEPLTKSRIEIVAHLMKVTLNDKCQQETTMSVLDIRNSKLLSPTVPIKSLNAMLDAEMAYIEAFWKTQS